MSCEMTSSSLTPAATSFSASAQDVAHGAGRGGGGDAATSARAKSRSLMCGPFYSAILLPSIELASLRRSVSFLRRGKPRKAVLAASLGEKFRLPLVEL